MARIRRQRASQIDECFDSWTAWRATCDAANLAYRRWATARVVERPLAFSRYRTALAIEEQHAANHAAVMTGDRSLRAVAS